MKLLLKVMLGLTILFTLAACCTPASSELNTGCKGKKSSCMMTSNCKLSKEQKLKMTEKFERMLDMPLDKRQEKIENCPMFSKMSSEQKEAMLKKCPMMKEMTPNDKAQMLEKMQSMLDKSPEQRKEMCKKMMQGYV